MIPPVSIGGYLQIMRHFEKLFSSGNQGSCRVDGADRCGEERIDVCRDGTALEARMYIL